MQPVHGAIYEEDFLGFSYGFRPGRDSVSQEWLVRFVEHRTGGKRIIRLIRKWLRAGILEDGTVTVSERGTGQGSVASPLLANIYLHYVFDLWAERWRRQEATGDMTENGRDLRRFYGAPPARGRRCGREPISSPLLAAAP